MFYVDLYSSTADPRERDKTNYITLIGQAVPLSPTAVFDLMAPQIIIDYDATLTAANYAYLPEFGKYYFLEPPKIQTGKRIVFQGAIDLLMTYKSYLLDVNATIIRSESVGSPTPIPDPQLPIDPNRFEFKSILFNKRFPLDVNQNNYLLITR